MPEDRDRLFEKALLRHLRAGAAGESLCPDAELLAAYQQRMLAREEMAAAESHIARCARCREILARLEASKLAEEPAMAVYEPATDFAALSAVSPAAPEKLAPIRKRRPWFGRPLVPAAAIAAGLLLWMGITVLRNRPKFAAAPSEVAVNRPEPSARQESDQLVNPVLKKPEPPADERRSKLAERESLPDDRRPAPAPLPPGPTAAPARLQQQTQAPAAAEQPAAGRDTAQAEADSGAALGSVPALRGSPSPPLAGPAPGPGAARKAQNQPMVAPLDKKDDADRQFSLSANYNSVAAKTVPVRFAAPGGKSIWSVGDYGLILLSKDGGRTWMRQYSAAQAALTAGSAPSDEVCWIAGSAGTLLRTTDAGQHWQAVDTPISGDLGGVQAADAQHASIWDLAHKARYETSDGGATWKPAPNE